MVEVAGMAGTAGFTVKKPQPLAQTCQSTPAAAAELAAGVTAAFTATVPFGCIWAGKDGTNATATAVEGTMAMGLEEIEILGLATEVATSVTAVPAAVTGGAV